MQNFWLRRKVRRRLQGHIISMILRIMGISDKSTPLNHQQVERCVDYGLDLYQQVGYTKALEELEKSIKTVVSLDRNRFVRS